MKNFEVIKHIESELSESQCRSLAEVINSAWPGSVEAYCQSIFNSKSNTRFRYVAWEGDMAIGTAICFNRVIKTILGDLTVFTIGGFCILPNFKNLGVGKSIMKKILETMPTDAATCMLQTRNSLEDYFTKMGFKKVSNNFRNNPFWDDIVMYYDNLQWTDGEIDINGPGW